MMASSTRSTPATRLGMAISASLNAPLGDQGYGVFQDVMMDGQFRLDGRDEYPHTAGCVAQFQRERLYQRFRHGHPHGRLDARVGNRVNEGYAELSVVLYLPNGRVACQFSRPAITANDKFVAEGLSVEVVEPLKRITMRYDGDLMLLDDPEVLRNPRLLGQAPRVPGKPGVRARRASPPSTAASRCRIARKPCTAATSRWPISTSTPRLPA